MTNINYRTILAADGNPTAIFSLPDDSRRGEYQQIANTCMANDSFVEQVGFLEGISHFQMSGGEFCGNAARAAAWLIAQRTGNTSGTFTMSGFVGEVQFTSLSASEVRCTFSNLPVSVRQVKVNNHLKGKLVDLGGIVHFVLSSSEKFKNNPGYYKKIHAEIVQGLDLGSRSAVGVIWQDKKNGMAKIDPVVWVRDINSFFYETACGSGTLAILAASGKSRLLVFQPSGKVILASKKGYNYSLTSKITEKT